MVNLFNEWITNDVFWVVFIVWVLVWKGFALWRAAHNKSKWWFGVMLIINTAGLLEIVYLFIFSKIESRKKVVEVSSPRAAQTVVIEPKKEEISRLSAKEEPVKPVKKLRSRKKK